METLPREIIQYAQKSCFILTAWHNLAMLGSERAIRNLILQLKELRVNGRRSKAMIRSENARKVTSFLGFFGEKL